MTQYPGASPEAVETDVTKPLEYAINTVSGVKLIRSQLARGPEPGVRRVPARHRHDAGDAGRARQDRAGAARLPARRQGSAGASAPTTRTQQPVVSLAVMSPTIEPARAHVAHRPDDRQGPGERAGRGAHRRQRARDAADPGPDQARRADRARHRRRPGDRTRSARRTRTCRPGASSRGQSDAIVRVEGKIKDPAQFGRIIVAQQGGGAGVPVAGRRRHRRREGGDVARAHQRPAGDHASTSRRRRTPTSSRPAAASTRRSRSSRSACRRTSSCASSTRPPTRSRRASTASSRRSSRARCSPC